MLDKLAQRTPEGEHPCFTKKRAWRSGPFSRLFWRWAPLRHSRFTPYAQFLFGRGYVWNNPPGVASTSQNAFVTAAGGGLDYNLNKRISIKPIQVEYVMTQIDSAKGFGSHQNDVGYSGGVVFKFGQ